MSDLNDDSRPQNDAISEDKNNNYKKIKEIKEENKP